MQLTRSVKGQQERPILVERQTGLKKLEPLDWDENDKEANNPKTRTGKLVAFLLQHKNGASASAQTPVQKS